MSCQQYHRLTCDDCGRSLDLAGHKVARWARSEANRLGWTCEPINGADFCPECSFAFSKEKASVRAWEAIQ